MSSTPVHVDLLSYTNHPQIHQVGGTCVCVCVCVSLCVRRFSPLCLHTDLTIVCVCLLRMYILTTVLLCTYLPT